MPRTVIDIEAEEDLANQVRKYLCLYDKSCAEFKDKRMKENAWRTIDAELGFEEGK